MNNCECRGNMLDMDEKVHGLKNRIQMDIVIYFGLFIIVGERQERMDLWKCIAIRGRKIQKIEESILMNVEKNLTLLRTLNLIDKKFSKNINNFNMYSYQGK